jgi:hypothetical protein
MTGVLTSKILSADPEGRRDEGVEECLFFLGRKGVFEEQEDEGERASCCCCCCCDDCSLASGGSTHSVGITQGNMVPSRAARFTQPGIDLPVNFLHNSSEK